MEKNRSQVYNFALDCVPILFHSQTTQFMKYLRDKGKEFLQFWWDHVGDQIPEDKRMTFAGINYDIEQIDKKTMLVTISLPTPKEDGDPYFLGLIARPEKRVLWVRLPTTEAYCLVRDDKCGQANLTSLGYITPNGIFRPRGIGLKATKQDFQRYLKNRLTQKKGNKENKK